MPRRRATAMLGSLPEATTHSTRRIPRTSIAQSTSARAARVTRPLPAPAGSSQHPASALPLAVSRLRRITAPTSVPSADQMPQIRPVSAATFSAYRRRKARLDSRSVTTSGRPLRAPMNSRPRSMCARNSSACHGSSGRSSAPSSPRGIAYIIVVAFRGRVRASQRGDPLTRRRRPPPTFRRVGGLTGPGSTCPVRGPIRSVPGRGPPPSGGASRRAGPRGCPPRPAGPGP